MLPAKVKDPKNSQLPSSNENQVDWVD